MRTAGAFSPRGRGPERAALHRCEQALGHDGFDNQSEALRRLRAPSPHNDKIASRIDTPDGLHVKAGRTFIGGVAWAQPVGVERVEVQIDGGRWQRATLGPSAGNDYWRQWYLPCDAKPGSHQVSCRATDKQGNVQTPARAMPFPNGASGIQRLVVAVA